MKKVLLFTLISISFFYRNSSAQTCTECKQRVIIVYDNEVKIPAPDYASMPANEQIKAWVAWSNLFYIAGGVRNYLRSDATADCFQRLDAAFYTQPDSINTTIKSGVGHPNIPPASGSVASGDYIMYGVITGGGSSYNLQLKLETAKSRELVKEFNIAFAAGFDPIPTGYHAASNFAPLYTICLDFEKKKRDSGEPFAIKPTMKLISEKTKINTGESTNVEFTLTDCDNVPLKNRTIEVMADAGTFSSSTLTTDGSGKCTAKYTAGDKEGTVQIDGRLIFRRPTDKPETTYDCGGLANIEVGKTPNWKVEGEYRFEENTSFEQILGADTPAALKITSETVKRNRGFINAILEMKSWGNGLYTTNKTISEKLDGETTEGFTERRHAEGTDEVTHTYEYLDATTTKFCETEPLFFENKDMRITISSQNRHFAFGIHSYPSVGGGQSNSFYKYCQDDNCQTKSTSDVIDCETNSYEDGTHSYTYDGVGTQDTTYTIVTSPSPGWTKTTEVFQLLREDGIKFYFQLLSKTTDVMTMPYSKQTTNTTEFVDFNVNSWGTPTNSIKAFAKQSNSLSQNFPNPFIKETTISYSIQKPGTVRLTVVDLYGREVRLLENSYQEVGSHSVNFNASGLKPGIYFCKLTGDGYTSVMKMLLINEPSGL